MKIPAASAPAPNPIEALRSRIAEVIRGKDEIIELALVALVAEGHLLLEDVPGVGKTTLALALAGAAGLETRRLQFTSDLLPADVLGVSVYDPRHGAFEFRPGPVFTNILLADEINRATPKTQGALLEAMNERQVSLEGLTRPLPRPFLVIATQNPQEYAGTFPLPESQLDRFLIKTSMRYPDRDHEREILAGRGGRLRLEALRPALGPSDLIGLQQARHRVRIDPALVEYLLDLVDATRRHRQLLQGVSPRGALALQEAARARAVVHGRDFVLPDDLKGLAPHVLAHRVTTREGGSPDPAGRVLREILQSVAVPL